MSEIREYIVVNKQLGMSAGKLAAQVAHAAVAPLLDNTKHSEDIRHWIASGQAKIVLAVSGEDELHTLMLRAQEHGFVEEEDFFPIRDACRTELVPDESGSRLTCVGFRPMNMQQIAPLTSQYPLYK